jgi:hypothetical protein
MILADEKDNYLLEIRGDVREGLRPTEEESLESVEASGDKVFYVVRKYLIPLDRVCKRGESATKLMSRSSSRFIGLVFVHPGLIRIGLQSAGCPECTT